MPDSPSLPAGGVQLEYSTAPPALSPLLRSSICGSLFPLSRELDGTIGGGSMLVVTDAWSPPASLTLSFAVSGVAPLGAKSAVALTQAQANSPWLSAVFSSFIDGTGGRIQCAGMPLSNASSTSRLAFSAPRLAGAPYYVSGTAVASIVINVTSLPRLDFASSSEWVSRERISCTLYAHTVVLPSSASHSLSPGPSATSARIAVLPLAVALPAAVWSATLALPALWLMGAAVTDSAALPLGMRERTTLAGNTSGFPAATTTFLNDSWVSDIVSFAQVIPSFSTARSGAVSLSGPTLLIARFPFSLSSPPPPPLTADDEAAAAEYALASPLQLQIEFGGVPIAAAMTDTSRQTLVFVSPPYDAVCPPSSMRPRVAALPGDILVMTQGGCQPPTLQLRWMQPPAAARTSAATVCNAAGYAIDRPIDASAPIDGANVARAPLLRRGLGIACPPLCTLPQLRSWTTPYEDAVVATTGSAAATGAFSASSAGGRGLLSAAMVATRQSVRAPSQSRSARALWSAAVIPGDGAVVMAPGAWDTGARPTLAAPASVGSGGFLYARPCSAASSAAAAAVDLPPLPLLCANGSDSRSRGSSNFCFWGEGPDCVLCPPGGLCPGGYRLWSAPGYYVPSETSLAAPQQCGAPSMQRCVGWSPALALASGAGAGTGSGSGTICGAGYAQGSYACSLCAPDYYADVSTNGACMACPVTSASPFAAFIGIGYVLAAMAVVGAALGAVTVLITLRAGGTVKGGLLRTAAFLLSMYEALQIVVQVARQTPASSPPLVASVFAVVRALQFQGVGPVPVGCTDLSPLLLPQILMGVSLGLVCIWLLASLSWLGRLLLPRAALCCASASAPSGSGASLRFRHSSPAFSCCGCRRQAALSSAAPARSSASNAAPSVAYLTSLTASAADSAISARIHPCVVVCLRPFAALACPGFFRLGYAAILVAGLLYAMTSNAALSLLLCSPPQRVSLAEYGSLVNDGSTAASASGDASSVSGSVLVSVVSVAPGLVCFEGTHRMTAILVGATLLLVTLGLPLIALAFLRCAAYPAVLERARVPHDLLKRHAPHVCFGGAFTRTILARYSGAAASRIAAASEAAACNPDGEARAAAAYAAAAAELSDVTEAQLYRVMGVLVWRRNRAYVLGLGQGEGAGAGGDGGGAQTVKVAAASSPTTGAASGGGVSIAVRRCGGVLCRTAAALLCGSGNRYLPPSRALHAELRFAYPDSFRGGRTTSALGALGAAGLRRSKSSATPLIRIAAPAMAAINPLAAATNGAGLAAAAASAVRQSRAATKDSERFSAPPSGTAVSAAGAPPSPRRPNRNSRASLFSSGGAGSRRKLVVLADGSVMRVAVEDAGDGDGGAGAGANAADPLDVAVVEYQLCCFCVRRLYSRQTQTPSDVLDSSLPLLSGAHAVLSYFSAGDFRVSQVHFIALNWLLLAATAAISSFITPAVTTPPLQLVGRALAQFAMCTSLAAAYLVSLPFVPASQWLLHIRIYVLLTSALGGLFTGFGYALDNARAAADAGVRVDGDAFVTSLAPSITALGWLVAALVVLLVPYIVAVFLATMYTGAAAEARAQSVASTAQRETSAALQRAAAALAVATPASKQRAASLATFASARAGGIAATARIAASPSSRALELTTTGVGDSAATAGAGAIALRRKPSVRSAMCDDDVSAVHTPSAASKPRERPTRDELKHGADEADGSGSRSAAASMQWEKLKRESAHHRLTYKARGVRR